MFEELDGEKVNWSLVAKKAWETRRKNGKGRAKSGEPKSRRVAARSVMTEDQKFMWRLFEKDNMDYLDWADKNEKEMVRRMRRKELMNRALSRGARDAGIFVGKMVKKAKVERGSWGVKIGN